MEKDAGGQKTKNNPSEPKPEGIKPQAIKCKDAGIQKTNKNPSGPKPDGHKPKGIKCQKTLEFKKQTKIHRSLNPTTQNQRQ